MNRTRLLLGCALAFLLGALFGCESPTAPCADRTIVTDTIGWVLRSATDTVGPITTTGPRCIRMVMGT